MKKQQLSREELDYIVSELQHSYKETATSLSMTPTRSLSFPKMTKSIKIGFIGMLIGILLILGAWFSWHLYTQNTTTLKSGTVIESIQQLSTLATAQEHVKTIFSEKDNKLFGKAISFNLPGTQRTVFLVVPATVTAGVDLKNVTEKEVTVNQKTKTIYLTLPHATLVQDPSIDLKNIQSYSNEGLLRPAMTIDEGFQLEDQAKQKIKDDALQAGLLNTAEANAQFALKDFFKTFNYSVDVTYK